MSFHSAAFQTISEIYFQNKKKSKHFLSFVQVGGLN